MWDKVMGRMRELRAARDAQVERAVLELAEHGQRVDLIEYQLSSSNHTDVAVLHSAGVPLRTIRFAPVWAEAGGRVIDRVL